MKRFADSVVSTTTGAVLMGLLVFPGASGQSFRQAVAGGPPAKGLLLLGGEGAAVEAQATTAGLDGRPHRRLHRADYALDLYDSPKERAFNALNRRREWGDIEFRGSTSTYHVTNGDRSSAASFHKTLPHDDLGQVDADAFDALLECVTEGTYDKCEAVPAGDDDGFLIQPIGGIAVESTGPASSALRTPPAAALNSEELVGLASVGDDAVKHASHCAANMAEAYWMSLTRDVPFSKYGEHETTIAASENLATMPGFAKMGGVAVGTDGKADPQCQLFRNTAMGAQTGPMISQFLLKDFTLDSITVTPQQTTFATGFDYMTDYDEWLHIQNGGSPSVEAEIDPVKRYVRNSRDLSRLVESDTIFTEAFRASLILFQEVAIDKRGFNGPYADSTRQKGFVSYGASHVMRILGSAEVAQRSSWYHKWNVHMYARPEAVAGTLHNVLLGKLDTEFHWSLLDNTELLERVASRNAELNPNGERTYMLSQASAGGSPAHPSYPAGHAVQNGAFATVLKALVGLERGSGCFDSPVFPDDEGLTLLPYDGCLTYEGELNKMATNIALGRGMDGVHWRFDSEEGLLLGETIGVRILQQEVSQLPEGEAYEFRLMAGQTIRLQPDGPFYVDDKECCGDTFVGVDSC